MAKQQTNKKHGRYIVNAFSVIEFVEEENYDRVFEAVPDSWFTDDTKTFCYWPPKTTSKSLMIAAVNCARPDDDWNIYECKVVSGGHASYASAYKVVRDKCSQKYNTSSAEDRIKADDYRRKHPVLALQGKKSFENLFTKPAAKDNAGDKNISESNSTRSELTNASDINDLHEDDEDGGAAHSLSTVREKSSSKQSKQQKLPTKSKGRTDTSQIRKISDSKHNTNAATKTSVEKVVGNSGSTDHSESSTSNSQSRSLQGSKVACSRNKTPESSISRSGSSLSRSGSSLSRSGSFRSRSGGSQSRSVRPRSRSVRPRSRSVRPRSRSVASRSRSVASRSRSEVSRSRSGESRSRSGGARSRSGSSRSRSESFRSRSGSSRSRSENYRSRSQSARSRQTNLRENSKKQLGAESLNLNVQSKQLTTSVVPEDGRSNSRKHTKYSSPRSRSSSSLEIIEHSNQPSSASRCQLRENQPQSSNIASRSDNSSPRVDRLMKLLEKCEQRQNENERRLIRMEVTLNKTFIMIGDLVNAKNYNVQKDGSSHNELIDMESEDEMDEFDEPKFPITNLIELDAFRKDLKNRRYKRFLIMHERDFCTPSKRSTHNVTMTKYLSRFVSMEVRCELTLKEKSGTTLMGKYKRVYQFLLDVMRAGYRLCHKFITQEDAHTALRIVWGRSKQYKNADDKKKQQRTNRKKDRSRQHRRNH